MGKSHKSNDFSGEVTSGTWCRQASKAFLLLSNYVRSLTPVCRKPVLTNFANETGWNAKPGGLLKKKEEDAVLEGRTSYFFAPWRMSCAPMMDGTGISKFPYYS